MKCKLINYGFLLASFTTCLIFKEIIDRAEEMLFRNDTHLLNELILDILRKSKCGNLEAHSSFREKRIRFCRNQPPHRLRHQYATHAIYLLSLTI